MCVVCVRCVNLSPIPDLVRCVMVLLCIRTIHAPLQIVDSLPRHHRNDKLCPSGGLHVPLLPHLVRTSHHQEHERDHELPLDAAHCRGGGHHLVHLVDAGLALGAVLDPGGLSAAVSDAGGASAAGDCRRAAESAEDFDGVGLSTMAKCLSVSESVCVSVDVCVALCTRQLSRYLSLISLSCHIHTCTNTCCLSAGALS